MRCRRYQPVKRTLSKFGVGITPITFFLLYCLLGLLNITAYDLLDWDEIIYAESARQMVERGNYLNIFVNDQPFAEKPPFFLWMMTASYQLFGVGELGARFPSVFSGAILFVVLYRAGSAIVSRRFGLLWAVVSTFSLLPTAINRASIMDATFNMFVALSGIGFYFFERALVEKNIRKQWQTLTLISIAMGLGVLTKGPLGGAIPVFSYGIYKWIDHKPMFGFAQFLYCAALSLGIVAVWPVYNWIYYGNEFMLRFWEFQTMLLSDTLEGHTGPFYYHFVAVALGFLPWTPVLFACPFRTILKTGNPLRPLGIIALAWTGMVLVVMSFAETKLPHYSSQVYVPLAFFVAYALEAYFKSRGAGRFYKYAGWIPGLLLIAAVMFVLPFALEYVSETNDYPKIYIGLANYFMLGILGVILIVVGGVFFRSGKCHQSLFAVCASLIVFWNMLYVHIIPELARIVQRPLYEQIEKYKRSGDIVFYEFLNFAPFFYNRVIVNVIGSYKFKGNPAVLSEPTPLDQYIFTSPPHATEIKLKSPSAVKIFSGLNFIVYKKKGIDP